MCRIYILLPILSIFIYFAAAQPAENWQNRPGDSNVDVRSSIDQTLDGGFIIAEMPQINDGDRAGNYGSPYDSISNLDSVATVFWENASRGMEVFPNPFSYDFRITFPYDPVPSFLKVDIISMEGHRINVPFTIYGSSVTVNGMTLNKGLYYVRIITGNNVLGQIKVIKE